MDEKKGEELLENIILQSFLVFLNNFMTIKLYFCGTFCDIINFIHLTMLNNLRLGNA